MTYKRFMKGLKIGDGVIVHCSRQIYDKMVKWSRSNHSPFKTRQRRVRARREQTQSHMKKMTEILLNERIN
jgi:hypothetical protein